MAKWKPIKTAPKDGTHILVGYWYNYSQNESQSDWEFVVDVAFFVQRNGIVDGIMDYQVHYVRDGELGQSWFTHWAPLPAPPILPT